MLKGRVIVRYDDHEEVLEAGDAFYLAEVEAALMKSMQAGPAD